MTAVLISLLLISMIVAGVTLLRAACKEFDKHGKLCLLSIQVQR